LAARDAEIPFGDIEAKYAIILFRIPGIIKSFFAINPLYAISATFYGLIIPV